MTQRLRLGNTEYAFAFDLTNGIRLANLENLRSGRGYLRDPRYASFGNPFTIELLGGNGCYDLLHSSRAFRVEEAQLAEEEDHQVLRVRARCTRAPLVVSLRVEVPSTGPASYWDLELENVGSEPVRGRLIFPRLAGVCVAEDLTAQTACLPMQVGGIRRRFAAEDPNPLVYPYYYVQEPWSTYAAPFAMPLMDLLSSDEDEGLFIAVLDPDVRRHVLVLTTIGEPPAGLMEVRRQLELAAGERLVLPRVAIGVHMGGWHVAVDAYREWVGDRLDPRDIPRWFREAVALYGVGGIGGGGAYLAYGPGPQGMVRRYRGPLDTEISSFDELPTLLRKARAMGTDVLYLWDYWEGEPETGMPPYWNKGDYVPRSDLGGPEAFRRGIGAVHSAGGRVLVYVEGFIIWKNSRLGQERGQAMALCDEHGAYYEEYQNNWSLCPADEAWQQCLTDICVRLVRDYDVDGIFLDSYGAQRHHTCYNRLHSHWPETDIWNKGLSEIIARVRSAIRWVKPDAVVVTESTSDLLLPVEDGSCDGSLVWAAAYHRGQLLGSPLKYGFPGANVFTNGYTLAHLNQVFALGLNLAVGPAWEEHAGYIRTLVEAKRRLADSLIYGRILPPLHANAPEVVATAFEGARSAVIAATNTGSLEASAAIRLPAEWEGSRWHAVVGAGDARVTAADGLISLVLAPGELQVWEREG